MKRPIIVLLLIASACNEAMAQAALKVSLTDNSRISVSVNGRYFNRQGTSVTVGDLPPGSQFLRVYAVSYTRRGRPMEDLVFEGTVRTYNGMLTNFLYDPYSHSMNIQQQDMGGTGRDLPTQHPDNNQYRAYYNDGSNNNSNGNNSYSNAPIPPAPDNTDDNSAYTPPPSSGPVASPASSGQSTLTDSKSEKLKTKVAAKGTDTDKLALLKEALKNERITTYQVSYIMDWFLFEGTKVEFAKWAYNIVTDKEYYSDLDSKFTYKSSQDDLDKFLKAQH